MRHPASTHAYRFGTAPTRGKLAMGRDVDALDALPDQKILQADREYLVR